MAAQPTVSVRVGGFLSRCSALDCSLSTNSSLTPRLTSLASQLVNQSHQLTITGSGLSDNPAALRVSQVNHSIGTLTAPLAGDGGLAVLPCGDRQPYQPDLPAGGGAGWRVPGEGQVQVCRCRG